MSWKIRISSRAREDLDYLRAYDPKSYAHSYRLTLSVQHNPFEGQGKPTQSIELGPQVWFRRLSLEHRMVYEVFEDHIIVASYRTHLD